jgi:hypothetical protein
MRNVWRSFQFAHFEYVTEELSTRLARVEAAAMHASEHLENAEIQKLQIPTGPG